MDWNIQKQAGTIFEGTPLINEMPLPTKLSRPMIMPRIYEYQAKKVELFVAETGENLHPKKIESITIDPIEGKYSMLLSAVDQDYPLPLRNVIDVKTVSSNIVELVFWGTMSPGITEGVGGIGYKDRRYILKVKTDEKYKPNFPELLEELKSLEKNSEYWISEVLEFPGNRSIDVYSKTPFLAEGEQIIWQNPKTELIDKKNQVISVEVLTNFRVLEYDYVGHKSSVILFPSLDDVKVSNQQHVTASSSVGTYTEFSNNVTGVKNVRTNSVVGDAIFYVQGKPVITFEKITDPEMLMTAVTTLKKQYDTFHGTNQLTEHTGADLHTPVKNTCSKCGNVNSGDSKFCNGCGSALSLSSILDDSEYVENKVAQRPADKLERYQDLVKRIPDYKPGWDKNGVIQYKTEYIAILQRVWGAQVQFIIAFDDLTKEGYRLMAIDEGKSGGDSSGGFTGGVNSFYYFQRAKYVEH